ncbi:pyrroline-5-carboxylate reductase [uncultured Salinisphaera sp.]|uniref:pyrroline-5-carboxylate reductase n=1 Tax=uncultured Salinisphaera sp. TaxID=359372 RepID=UPI0032B309B9
MSTRIAFFGGGNMAASLIAGLRQAGWAGADIVVVDRNADKLAALHARHDVVTASSIEAADLDVDVVMLAVKPQVMDEAIAALRAALGTRRPLAISIAAGIPLSVLNLWLGADIPCIRTMPNTPSQLGVGATGLYAPPSISHEARDLADRIMATAGINVWVNDETDIDTIIATSGSGPAYYFAFMEAMIDAATDMGLPRESAQELVLQTALGAARMACESGDDPATLRAKVTSKGGTTAEALAQFQQADLAGIVARAMQASADRAGVMAGELAERAAATQTQGDDR